MLMNRLHTYISTHQPMALLAASCRRLSHRRDGSSLASSLTFWNLLSRPQDIFLGQRILGEAQPHCRCFTRHLRRTRSCSSCGCLASIIFAGRIDSSKNHTTRQPHRRARQCLHNRDERIGVLFPVQVPPLVPGPFHPPEPGEGGRTPPEGRGCPMARAPNCVFTGVSSDGSPPTNLALSGKVPRRDEPEQPGRVTLRTEQQPASHTTPSRAVTPGKQHD